MLLGVRAIMRFIILLKLVKDVLQLYFSEGHVCVSTLKFFSYVMAADDSDDDDDNDNDFVDEVFELQLLFFWVANTY